MEVYGEVFWDAVRICGIHTNLAGNDADLQALSLLEQLLKAGQDTLKTLQGCEIAMCCQQS